MMLLLAFMVMIMQIKNILILGGYGNFGKRIIENLARLNNITLFIAGRHFDKASALCQELTANHAKATLHPAVIDINSPTFTEELATLQPDIVIHTSGPFQGQDYHVAQSCIAIGSHYIDLADGRDFVCRIHELDQAAKEKGILLVSGASSVPGLSSAVIDCYQKRFSRMDCIDFAIAPGNRAERGYATVNAILSYTGHAFPMYIDGQWQSRYGWSNARRLNFGEAIGKRPVANVDIPDLSLFPERYPDVKTVIFQAGLELPILHYGMVAMAWLAKKGVVKNWAKYTSPILRASRWFERAGTDVGGMRIDIKGTGLDGQAKHLQWVLCATEGVGPYIPTLSATILTKKLISGTLEQRGAMPCLGLFDLSEFDFEIRRLNITHAVYEDADCYLP